MRRHHALKQAHVGQVDLHRRGVVEAQAGFFQAGIQIRAGLSGDVEGAVD